MRILTPMLGLAAGLALAACGNVSGSSGPPVSGTTAGPGAPPLQQQTRDIGGTNSGNASAGTPSITGSRGGGRPEVGYTGPASGNVGSPNQPTLPTTGRSRSN